MHDYGQISDHLYYSEAMDSNNQYVFIGCIEKLKQYRTDDHELVKEYLFVEDVFSVVTTFDGKYAFAGISDGSVHQICVDSQTVIKDYGQIHHNFSICTMALPRDNNFFITGGNDPHVRKTSIPNRKVVQGSDITIPNRIRTMQLAPGNEILFVCHGFCNLKSIDLTDGTSKLDFETDKTAKGHGLKKILVTRDGGYMYTISNLSEFKRWSVWGRALVQDFGHLKTKIRLICD